MLSYITPLSVACCAGKRPKYCGKADLVSELVQLKLNITRFYEVKYALGFGGGLGNLIKTKKSTDYKSIKKNKTKQNKTKQKKTKQNKRKVK